MSNFENINQEAQDAQQQYEQEMANQEPKTQTQKQSQVQPKPKVREGWTTNDGSFFTFKNYDNLPAEYKAFIPREPTKTKNRPVGIDPIEHVDPVDGLKYKYGVTFFDNGGTSVWSRRVEEGSSGGGGSGNKSFQLDVGIAEYSVNEANALLAANESDRVYRYKPYGESYETEKTVTKDENGNMKTVTKRALLLVKQKRIMYG